MRACERHQDRRLTGGNAVVPVRPENWRVCSSPDPPRPPGQQGGKEKAGKTRRRPMWKERGGGGRVPKETVRLWGGSGRRWGAERVVAPDQVRREATAREDAGARAARRPEGWIGGSPANPAARATGARTEGEGGGGATARQTGKDAAGRRASGVITGRRSSGVCFGLDGSDLAMGRRRGRRRARARARRRGREGGGWRGKSSSRRQSAAAGRRIEQNRHDEGSG